MTALLHDLVAHSASRTPAATALKFKKIESSYEQLHAVISGFAGGLISAGLQRQERVAVYLPKRPETVATIFGATHGRGRLRAGQPLAEAAPGGPHPARLRRARAGHHGPAPDRTGRRAGPVPGPAPAGRSSTALPDEPPTGKTDHRLGRISSHRAAATPTHRVIDTDMAAILYTSGSTGKPKGVVLSHKNMVTGAKSVAQYLENRADDRLLAVLPLSFDYGFSQLSTAFHVGASVVLMDYLFPRDVLNLVVERTHHRPGRRAARVDPAGGTGMAGRPSPTTCAISPTRAAPCRPLRSPSCEPRGPRPSRT